jgi:hypothetical protein
MGDWPAYRWENMWDRPMHRSKLYSMVLQENSSTILTELKFPIRWNLIKHEFPHSHLRRCVHFMKSNRFHCKPSFRRKTIGTSLDIFLSVINNQPTHSFHEGQPLPFYLVAFLS